MVKKTTKQKEVDGFLSNLKKARKRYTKILNPRICYTSEFDIFSMIWGNQKIDSTIETNLLGGGDLRFDVTKKGIIVGIEIENFSDVLKKFDCDKKENIKELNKMVKK